MLRSTFGVHTLELMCTLYYTNISSNNSIGGAKGKKSYDIHEAEGLKPAPAKSVGGGVAAVVAVVVGAVLVGVVGVQVPR